VVNPAAAWEKSVDYSYCLPTYFKTKSSYDHTGTLGYCYYRIPHSEGAYVMKIFLCLLFISRTLFSQGMTSEGKFTLGGKISFSSVNNGGHSSTELDLSPNVSMFVGDNLELGMSLTLVHQNWQLYSSQTQYGAGPYLNLYLTSNHTQPFVGIAYNYLNNAGVPFSQDDAVNRYTVQAGVSVPLNDNVALQPVIQYSFYKQAANSDYYSYTNSNTVTTLLVGIGIKAFL
jgi:hypothetical protein